ncbi:uncharacterized protein LOC8265347 [Ricinus communis]|uniref:DUF7792 domain-containing protein n=1 Tax=Ricinus communis TaxID=3988 RepID=B9SQL8_RICCO|nr:uncharacterized protein LOC8265347 [Ricinus communis]EEF34125.1 conserved hypothetical protein [Ricinus communis]|eukprot:XP_002528287.1 uncharacterized protein LOC8265347 [Ricinus communis]
MADIVKEILARPIQLADQVTKSADEAQSFKQDCLELKAKTEKLATLLRQAARASNDLYERPTRRIIDDTEQVLDKALALVIKCRATGIMKRMFTIIPSGAFRKTSMQLENSIGDVSWLLRVSASAGDRDDEYLGLPPIAANEPILCLIWEQVAILFTGSLEERSDAAASLVSLARDNDRYGKLIIEEGGVPPLLKLAKEGKMEGQENAARAIGLLGRDPESVEQIVNAGVCSVFAKILKEGHMKVQLVVAWAVSELAANHPKCQDHFAQNNIIRFLVSHLAFETVQEHSKYTIASKQTMSIHSVLMASNDSNEKGEHEDEKSKISHPMNNSTPSQMHNVITNTLAMKNQNPNTITKPNQSQSPTKNMPPLANQVKGNQNNARQQKGHPQHHVLTGTSIKGREFEDPGTKAQMKAMAARALWQLCIGNVTICRSITESRALLCFAVLLEKGPDDVQSYSAMALMEITAVAEQTSDLRRSAFKPTSPAAKAVVDQMLKVIEKADSVLLTPCVKAIGNLARTFRATETRIIGPLVKLLDEREPEITMEAAIALNKFAAAENFLCVNHSKAIISAGGAKHLIQLVYFGEQMVQIPSLILLCYISLNCPDSEVLANEEVLIVLEWSSKQAHLTHEPTIESLLQDAKSRLELYQSRGSRGFH